MSKCSDFPYLPHSFELEVELLDQLSNRPGNQRCVVGRDELLLVVHEVPKAGVPEREALIFWRRQDESWFDHSSGRGLKRLGELFDRYTRIIDEHEEQLEKVDTAAEVFALARISGPLARASRNLALAIDQTLQHDEDNRELRSYRDRARELERAAEQLNHDARLTLEFWMAEHSEQQQEASEKLNKIAFRLNLLAGFFLPLAAIGGIMGMNVAIPSFTQGLFWLILFGGLGVGGFVVWWIVRTAEREK